MRACVRACVLYVLDSSLVVSTSTEHPVVGHEVLQDRGQSSVFQKFRSFRGILISGHNLSDNSSVDRVPALERQLPRHYTGMWATLVREPRLVAQISLRQGTATASQAY